jgi:hypothetical protein
MSYLEPCPFCGEMVFMEKKPLWRTNCDGTTHGYHGCFKYDVYCRVCGCTINLPGNDTVYRTDEEAIKNVTEAWDRRA